MPLKISIITVTYNCANTLQATIDSVVEQNYPYIDYIVVDGASTDNTIDIIKSNNSNISKWISEPDNGIYDAMKKGVVMATGDYVYFLGGDDTLYPRAIERVVALISDITSIYYGDVQLCGECHGTYGGRFDSFELIRRNICHQSIFYPRSIFTHRGYTFNLDYRTFADYVLNMELWGAGYRFIYTGIIVANFRVGGASMSGDTLFFTRRKYLTKRYFGVVGLCYYTLRVKGAALAKKIIGQKNG